MRKMSAKDAKRLKKLQSYYRRQLEWYAQAVGDIGLSPKDAILLENCPSPIKFKVAFSMKVGRYGKRSGCRSAWLEPKIEPI